MKIAVDASRLKFNNRTGTHNYLYHLIKHLSKIDDNNEYVIYFKDNVSKNQINNLYNNKLNFSYKVLPKVMSWTQLSFAFEMFKCKPDIIFCTWHTMPVIYPFWKSKIVATIHDITGKYLPTLWTCKFSDKLIAVSNSTKKDASDKYGIRHEKIKVIYEGVDSSFYKRGEDEIRRVRQKYDINRDYLLFVGTLGKRKNIKRMVEAFNKANLDIDFVLGGSAGPDGEGLTKLLAKFIGRVDQNDLPALYSGARAFIYASLLEGFGLPILESFLCGTPVITSNTSSMKEVAGDAAYFVDPKSVDSIKNGIINVTSGGSQLVQKGYKRVQDLAGKRLPNKH